MRITRVTTKTGDKGTTALVGGARVSKASLRVDAYGDIDELNSCLGVIRAQAPPAEVDAILAEVQNALFTVGCDLASPPEVKTPRTTDELVTRLDSHLEKIQTQLEPLEEFVLPGGSPCGAWLHLARTVARRSERSVVRLSGVEEVTPQVVIYLNRLSDLLFVLARAVNQNAGVAEPLADFSKRG
jgi:cob(I)alamin adenosyltransferase